MSKPGVYTRDEFENLRQQQLTRTYYGVINASTYGKTKEGEEKRGFEWTLTLGARVVTSDTGSYSHDNTLKVFVGQEVVGDATYNDLKNARVGDPVQVEVEQSYGVAYVNGRPGADGTPTRRPTHTATRNTVKSARILELK